MVSEPAKLVMYLAKNFLGPHQIDEQLLFRGTASNSSIQAAGRSRAIG